MTVENTIYIPYIAHSFFQFFVFSLFLPLRWAIIIILWLYIYTITRVLPVEFILYKLCIKYLLRVVIKKKSLLYVKRNTLIYEDFPCVYPVPICTNKIIYKHHVSMETQKYICSTIAYSHITNNIFLPIHIYYSILM